MEAFDHYTKYGAHSGTIWHSELCNSDGVPYKPSPFGRRIFQRVPYAPER
jgi:hypothetical protein